MNSQLGPYREVHLNLNPMFLTWGLILILIATVLDFLDGFAAKLLKVQSEIGAQLDSLADMVTFGVAPGFLFYALSNIYYPEVEWLKYLFILIPVFSLKSLAISTPGPQEVINEEYVNTLRVFSSSTIF